jgi:CheY-like chemotaxis protein
VAEAPGEALRGRRLLVVEDEYLVATDLAEALADLGVEVIGPAGSVGEALEFVETAGAELDAAVLDINLRDERVFPVAEVLAARGVPFIFTTGYDAVAIPNAFVDIPRCEKPVDRGQLIRWLANALRRSRR